MARIRGRYINLDRAEERRDRIEKNISLLGWSADYHRFPAETSSNEEGKTRGLTGPEFGLWKSWAKLLHEEAINSESNEFDYLHIIEDDAVLSPMIKTLINKLGTNRENIDLLFTEMYVNPGIWISLYPEITRLKDDGTVILHRDYYTGCASSILIPRKRIKHVHSTIQKHTSTNEKLLPIDNSFRLLKDNGSLEIVCTFPFLSHVDSSCIRKSNIQERTNEANPIDLTQELNALLRESLSTLENKELPGEIVKKIIELAQLKSKTDVYRILKIMLSAATEDNLMKYKHDKRLAGQKDNPQNKE